MLMRLYFVLAVLWAFVFLANGATKTHGVQGEDVLMAAAPLIIGLLSWRLGRFVIQGR